MKPTDGHPPIHALGELAEGVLEQGQTAAARAHVDACPECRASLASLGHVTDVLRSAPTVPIPSVVSTRIAAALAAEAAAAGPVRGLSVVGSSSADRDEPTGTVAWFRRRMPQALAAAASVAVVALGGYVITTGGQGDSSGDAPAAGAASDDQAVAQDPPAEAGETAPELDTPNSYGADEVMGEEAVEAAIADVWSSRAELSDGCGATLAATTGDTLVGSASHAESVLVVVESSTGGELTGWLVPDCAASTDEAIGDPLTIPTP